MEDFFKPPIFDQFPEVVAAHSLRNSDKPGGNSMLPKAVSAEDAKANRIAFASELGFDQIYTPKLIHGDAIYTLADAYTFDERPEADAIITDQSGKLIGIGVADCIVALLYDPTHKIIAAAHSGWRGSAANIVGKTIEQMKTNYQTQPADLICYLSPSPLRFEYGLPTNDAKQFDQKYYSAKSADDKWLDNKLVVFDQLLAAGLNPEHIETDPRSNFGPEFHSYRRDRDASGRHMVVIGLK